MNNPPTLSPSTNFFFWKLCAWAGPLYLIGSLISWALIAGFVPPPREDWTALQITQFYLDNSLRIRVGLVLTLLFQPFYVFLSVVTSRVMGKVEGRGGILGTLELFGGVLTWATIAIALLCWLTAAFRPELRTPQEVMLLSDLGWMVMDAPFMGATIQCFAFGTLFLLDKREKPLVPSWVCWLSFAIGALYITAALIPFFTDGPFSWHGLITFWLVFSMFFIWFIPISYFMIKAVDRIEQEECA